jgi:DNA-binding beta-propeller fold protein YncE
MWKAKTMAAPEPMTSEMGLHRRDFARIGGGWLLALVARPLAAQTEQAKDPLPAPRVVLTWGSNGHDNGQFDKPIAIVINPQDEILIADFLQKGDVNGRVQRFDPEGRFLGSFEVDPMPGGLALDKDGLLYATHMMNHKVAVYDPTGKKVREFGKLGTAPGEFEQPGGIAFGPDGSLYVVDQVNHRVQRLTPQGEPISTWGSYGVKTGQFGGNSSVKARVGGPHFLAFNSQGDLYTTEGSVGRIQKFKADGTFLLAWGDNQIGPGHFGRPTGLQGPIAIAIDSKDQVWVTATNHYVQQFTGDGCYLRRLGGLGSEPGQFRTPHGLAFDSQDYLYVADSQNSRIQKLAI